ncbi:MULTISPECIES: DUF2809 domain-containing protein [Weeksella]|uniref:DUF2809 domain-containing protein n=1 Tax=Weeksella virosa (strain ATCC 43766 / DSM 16922 / JCM 21250 / CCUG 30538 / CDC 9751 / IAM 14551 / NBRC 16016 / NCTC 11634 / CL345/78) TaxID=865938 RepID=F0P2Y5_WEEVC|nr:MULTISPECIES: DUF2809 domain-containing protein [Weeksella]ADX67897.1 hypothetical protein Weevi_1188 [Weeksella virosa DSM 16922]MDK7374186.1 DUF2809 domain-containing protein [Weeksella virosa]MDK7674498.1 DUF2809 domain-containing protein [Weeksella virosa]OFM82862.1 hypothetical protein HMPREF2660_04220 [Weeksella sp. HMSC059D05]SUP54200.1 Protein of uncharacterised function (DUF2809) [Weeksella virosa]
MLQIRPKYFFFTLILAVAVYFLANNTETIVLQQYIKNIAFILFLYCFVRSFFRFNAPQVLGFSLFACFLLKLLQATNFFGWIGILDQHFLQILIGNVYSWWDILSYTIGFLVLIAIDPELKKNPDNNN